MEANQAPEPSGDVNAERAHSAAPWWLRGLTAVAIAAVSTLTYGGPVTGAALVVWIVFAVLFVGLVAIGIALGWQRYMSVRRRRASAPSLIVLIGMLVAWAVLAKVLQRLTTPGTVASYTAQFVSAAIIFGAGMTALARMDARATQPPR
jgi:cation transport ATPase